MNDVSDAGEGALPDGVGWEDGSDEIFHVEVVEAQLERMLQELVVHPDLLHLLLEGRRMTWRRIGTVHSTGKLSPKRTWEVSQS